MKGKHDWVFRRPVNFTAARAAGPGGRVCIDSEARPAGRRRNHSDTLYRVAGETVAYHDY